MRSLKGCVKKRLLFENMICWLTIFLRKALCKTALLFNWCQSSTYYSMPGNVNVCHQELYMAFETYWHTSQVIPYEADFSTVTDMVWSSTEGPYIPDFSALISVWCHEPKCYGIFVLLIIHITVFHAHNRD